MSYMDGYLIPVPVGSKDAYVKLAQQACQIFLEHGATRVVESWSDDVPHGKLTDFYRAVQATQEEGVVFAWILWPSKQVRDVGMKAAMNDPRMDSMSEMPFEGKRMIFGGFSILLDKEG